MPAPGFGPMEHAGPAMSYGQPVADMEDDLSAAVGTDLRALVRNVSTDYTVSIVVKFLAVDVYTATKGFAGQVLDHRSLWSGWTLVGLAPARTRCSATCQPFLGPWSRSWHTGYGDASPTEFGSAGGVGMDNAVQGGRPALTRSGSSVKSVWHASDQDQENCTGCNLSENGKELSGSSKKGIEEAWASLVLPWPLYTECSSHSVDPGNSRRGACGFSVGVYASSRW